MLTSREREILMWLYGGHFVPLLILLEGQQVSRILTNAKTNWKGLWRLRSPSKVRYGESKLDLWSYSSKTQ